MLLSPITLLFVDKRDPHRFSLLKCLVQKKLVFTPHSLVQFQTLFCYRIFPCVLLSHVPLYFTYIALQNISLCFANSSVSGVVAETTLVTLPAARPCWAATGGYWVSALYSHPKIQPLYQCSLLTLKYAFLWLYLTLNTTVF